MEPPSKWYAHRHEPGIWHVQEAADELIQTVEAVSARLRNIRDDAASRKPAPGKWSVKEIIGHLVDSAANNHQRFIRAQDGPYTGPGYAQDAWVERQGYGSIAWPELLELWRLYNRHLAAVIKRIPPEKLDTECRIGQYEPVPLGFVVEDYVAHLKHHVRQIEAIEKNNE